jgi:hypothetical protein
MAARSIGVRAARDLLEEQFGQTKSHDRTKLWHGELAFLEWSAASDRARIEDGADSSWIRDGKIQAMTIHDTVQEE